MLQVGNLKEYVNTFWLFERVKNIKILGNIFPEMNSLTTENGGGEPLV